MGFASAGGPAPARVLLVADEVARAGVWRKALAEGGRTFDLDVVAQLPEGGTGDYQAIVVDAPRLAPGAGAVAGLYELVERGASLVVRAGAPGEFDPAWWELTGARPVRSEPFGEWFLKTADPTGGLTTRFPSEFPVGDSLVQLELAAESNAVLLVSVGFQDHAVMSERRLGAGRVVVTGADGAGRDGFGTELARLLRRALRPVPSGGACGRLGLGVVGYGPFGGMGFHHGLAAQATEGIELLAVCDSDPGRLKAAEEAFPGLRTSMNADDLAADEDVDLVVVATPPISHATLALALLRAGKHVVIEKPMCLTVAEADELIAVAAAHEVALTVYQSRRFDPDFVALSRLVEAGTLGTVFNMETFVGGFEHPCRAWHSETSISGGAIYDWGSHHLDWILQLMGGFPASLTAHGHKRVWHDVTNHDQVRVRLTWEDGREAEFVQSDVAGVRPPKFYVQGTSGTAAGWYRPLLLERLEPGIGYVGDQAHHAEAPVELHLARFEPGIGLTETRIPPARVPQYAFHRNLVDHLQFGEPLAVTAESAKRVVALLEAAQQSAESGSGPVALPRL